MLKASYLVIVIIITSMHSNPNSMNVKSQMSDFNNYNTRVFRHVLESITKFCFQNLVQEPIFEGYIHLNFLW